jgi:homoserine kinase type II
MGIKVQVQSRDLPLRYQHHRLIPTTQGVMASVYLLDHIYVLKLFDRETSLSIIDAEITLLDELHGLPIPRVVERFQIKEHEVVIFTQILGEMPIDPSLENIRQIGYFLKKMHLQTEKILLKKEKLFSINRVAQLIFSTKNKLLQKYFESMKLTLHDDGIIHGDLFPDNCKFLGEELSGVYDFSDASLGDFHFELAVVTSAWCFDGVMLNQEKMNQLLEAYEYKKDSKRAEFMVYLKYALLYYTTTRHIANRDYQELLDRLENL